MELKGLKRLKIIIYLSIAWGLNPRLLNMSHMSQVSSLLALMALIGFAVVEVATRVFT